MRILGNPKIDASNQSARVCIANCARFFILAIFGFPGVLPFPRGIFCSALALRRGTDYRFNFDVSFVKSWCQLFLSFYCFAPIRSRSVRFIAASVLDHAEARKTQTQLCLRSLAIKNAPHGGGALVCALSITELRSLCRRSPKPRSACA